MDAKRHNNIHVFASIDYTISIIAPAFSRASFSFCASSFDKSACTIAGALSINFLAYFYKTSNKISHDKLHYLSLNILIIQYLNKIHFWQLILHFFDQGYLLLFIIF